MGGPGSGRRKGSRNKTRSVYDTKPTRMYFHGEKVPGKGILTIKSNKNGRQVHAFIKKK